MGRYSNTGNGFSWKAFIGVLFTWAAAAVIVCRRASAAGGPCSTPVNATSISVREVADLYKRLDYNSTTTVKLVVEQDLHVSDGITFSSDFSCTIFTSKGVTPASIILDDDSSGPVLAIWGASNVLVQNLNIRLSTYNDSPPCNSSLPLVNSNMLCPAIYIYQSWGIQVVKGSNIWGRIDVFDSTQVSLDSLNITTVRADLAVANFAYLGDGPGLISAQVSLTNCKITGGFTGAFIGRASVGVVVANNYFLNQVFTGIQCGSGAHNVGDCMLSQISNNYITVTPGFNTTSDSSAIYFASHWVNPGNYLSCNYALGVQQCMYLDWTSSGVVVDGMICFNTSSGLKLNTGHSNRVSSFVVVNANLPGWISCQNYQINNCLQESGQYWDTQRLASYNSPAFRQKYPWLDNFCNLTTFKGVECNPSTSAPANVTGACSGIPTGNEVQIVIVDPRKPKSTPTFLSCKDVLTVVPKLNSLNYTSPPLSNHTMLFNDYNAADFGLQPSSPVYKLYPNFRSCPKSTNGIQKMSSSSYLTRYNVLPGPLVGDL